MEVPCLLLLYWKQNKSVWFWLAWISQKNSWLCWTLRISWNDFLFQFKLHRSDWYNPDIITKSHVQNKEDPYSTHTATPVFPLPSGSCPEHTAETSQAIAEIPSFFNSVKHSPSWTSGISKHAYTFVVFYLNYYCSTDWTVYYLIINHINIYMST